MLSSRTILLIGLAFVFVGTKGDDGFNLDDALIEDNPKTSAPAVDPEFPDIDLDFDNPKVPVNPKKPNSNSDNGFDLEGAVNGEDKYTPTKAPKKPPKAGDTADNGFNLEDAINGEDKYTPTKAPKKPPKAGGTGRLFNNDDLLESGGKSQPNVTSRKGGSNEKDQGSGSGTLTGIITGVLLALGGGVSSYVLYQKKKLCFALTGNSGEQNTKQENVHGQREDPQSYSTLLQAQPAGTN